MNLRSVIFCAAVLLSLDVSARKVKTVEGEYTFYAPENMSPAEARRVATDRAMIAAIANEFGTLVSQNSSSVVKNDGSETDNSFFSIGGSEVKGEWIRTIGSPRYTITYEQDMLVVKAWVKGEACEIETASIDLDVRTLRHAPDLKYETREFKDNDDIFLYFRSPENGYLAVFLLDETTATVSLLLPYESSGLSSYPVKRGSPYIFFSENTCERSEAGEVENYVLMCSAEVEYNSIYVVFSPDKFTSPLSDTRHLEVPVISYEEFSKWLTRNRKHDKRMNVQTITVKINK